jgi:hypothetical protein
MNYLTDIIKNYKGEPAERLEIIAELIKSNKQQQAYIPVLIFLQPERKDELESCYDGMNIELKILYKELDKWTTS